MSTWVSYVDIYASSLLFAYVSLNDDIAIYILPYCCNILFNNLLYTPYNIISDLNFITSFLYIFLISLHNTLPVCVNAYNYGNISFNSLLKLEIPIFDLFYAINFLYLKILALAILLQ
mgnify:FL=1